MNVTDMPTLEAPTLPPSVSELAPRPLQLRSSRKSERLAKFKPASVSFGGTAAIVTSMGLISGLAAANGSRASVMGALLIAAVADNLTDSLSVHMYQEAERLEQREAFLGTLANFGTRLLLCLTFVLIVAVFGVPAAAGWGIVWGMALLSGLTYLVARHRGVSALSEVGKHVTVAIVVIVVSQVLGRWITSMIR